ncbi:hypothetical protein CJD36_008625 [Flavipsychrobacter stenotrophus]|uniref:Secretion system C-terminal sorting domain-containing protein n=1 Tax=Flavipsychrobacter stenotrophus TaxID=2077091 RepID=A0A2S7SYS8_9BACT|nr:T9SS type A sorting domain-containing protein [Flavipsychrobacter stenotrophus]PQJ11848.1 hypothetical protein CJD36_008625 [Flavipsychrobacter stenotrophus]
MKKIIFLLLAVVGNSVISLAQDTLKAAGLNPILGESYFSVTCDTTGVVPGNGGAGVTWDFSGLVATSWDTGIAVTCASTPNCAMFPGTTIAIKSLTGPTVNYAIANSTKYSQNGYYFSSSQYATFSDPLDQLHYPMGYLDSFTDTYAGTIIYTVGSLPITAHENGIAIVGYDGYGTLKLPDGSTQTNTMRTHSYQLYVDSASVFGIDTVASFILNTYTWYKNGTHSPLMTILTSDQVAGSLHTKIVSWSKRNFTLGITSLSELSNSLTLYPNPASNELNIQLTPATGDHVRITMIDLLGREVAVITDETAQANIDIHYNTSTLPRGLYLIRMQAGSETVTKKVTLQ